MTQQPKPLTQKRQAFVNAIVEDPTIDYSEAAKRAGFSAKYADREGSRLYNTPEIKAEIDRRREVLQEKSDITQEWVLNQLVSVAQRCMQAEPVRDKDGNNTGEYRFDSAGSNRALELVGKHLGMFKDGPNLTINIAQTIQQLSANLGIKQITE